MLNPKITRALALATALAALQGCHIISFQTPAEFRDKDKKAAETPVETPTPAAVAAPEASPMAPPPLQ